MFIRMQTHCLSFRSFWLLFFVGEGGGGAGRSNLKLNIVTSNDFNTGRSNFAKCSKELCQYCTRFFYIQGVFIEWFLEGPINIYKKVKAKSQTDPSAGPNPNF